MGMNNYIKCPICGKMFLKIGNKNTCNSCGKQEEELFVVVKEYLRDFPNASVAEVTAQTEISEELIFDWIKQGRIENKGSTKSYSCEMCGKPIHVGKICRKCQEGLNGIKKELADTIKNDTKTDKNAKGVYTQDSKFIKKY